jgi:PhzF family phenazine biosynthesis protein
MAMVMYQVDAFTNTLFGGNPAAVVPLDSWLSDNVMQQIAAENNLSETAFFVPSEQGYDLRWFTPANEVKLCGHATLASAYVVFRFLKPQAQAVTFSTLSGVLTVTREGDRMTMNFPAWPHTKVEPNSAVLQALNVMPTEYYEGNYMMAVLPNEQAVRAAKVDMRALAEALPTGLIITAPGDQVDFVSRSFFPDWGVDEDPVTGSSHCMLTPYWSARLGKAELTAQQVSQRMGHIDCKMAGDRVFLSGHAVLYSKGEILL